MAGRKKLYSFVEVSDSVPIQKLKIRDQLRILLKQITMDPANDLKNQDIANEHILQLKATLFDFIHKATAPIRNGLKHSVVMSVDSSFKPVLNEVLLSPDITNYYEVKVASPHIEYDIPYNIMVKLTVKDK